MDIPVQPVFPSALEDLGVRLYLKRIDQLHGPISGNKYFKLKYNLEEAKSQGFSTLLTYGGAFSNHILATAKAGKIHDFKTIGIIRGEELSESWRTNATLAMAHEAGMHFKFVSRKTYSAKDSPVFRNALKTIFGPFYNLPEGGTNDLAVKGCSEILSKEDQTYNYICCPVGTGGTLAGICKTAGEAQHILGFAALAGDFVKKDILKFTSENNWTLISDFHFGGYAKITEELINFVNNFKSKTGIPLDPVYTGKMMFGIMTMVKNGYFAPGTKILALHTGGLQGIAGMNSYLQKKKLPLLEL